MQQIGIGGLRVIVTVRMFGADPSVAVMAWGKGTDKIARSGMNPLIRRTVMSSPAQTGPLGVKWE